MNEFDLLRRRLRSAARHRRVVRLRDALLLTAGLAAGSAYVYYRIDRWSTLVAPARLLLDVVWLAAGLWGVRRWIRPAWRTREDEIDVALGLAGDRAGDTDLVAALQFETALRSGQADAYGSVGLLEAVVEQTSLAADEYQPAEEPLRRPSLGARRACIAIVAAVALAAAFYPRHFAAFVDRALLGEAHYPSRTQIVSLKVNGAAVPFAPDAAARLVVAQGRPIDWELTATGELPDRAVLELVGADGGTAQLELSNEQPDAAARERSYRGRSAPPVESVLAKAHAGDAYTELLELVVTPLPLVTVSLDVRLPDYAAGAAVPAPPPGRLSAAVLEGSRVGIRVECANKSLREVTLTLGGQRLALRRADEAGRQWNLDPTGTPLAAVAEPLEFAVEIEDVDGFRLPEPLKGSLLLRPDQPPTVAAEVITKYVLPAGKPSIAYQAGDDLGVRSLAVLRQVLRGDGSTASDRVEIPLDALGPRTSLAGKFPLELASLELHKGDRVTIRLEARDRGGDENRATAQSEPFTLEVTDEQGLYEAMAETDQRSARKMDEIIQKQLLMTGRGSTPATGTPPVTTPLVPSAAPSPTSSSTGTATPPRPKPSPSPPAATSPAPPTETKP